MKHTIQVLVENKFGVLARIASLFSARGYNISSLSVSETQNPTISCMTIVVNAEDERILEQIEKQLNKLIDVITVIDLTKKEHIECELFLVKLTYDKEAKPAVDKFKASHKVKVIEESHSSCILEFSGNNNEIRDFLSDLKNIEVKELVRTGKVAITK